MHPTALVPPFVSNAINSFAQGILDQIMKGIWVASLALLRAAMVLVDRVSGFSLTFDSGKPVDATIAAPWELLRNLSLLIALGLFFWQLGATVLRGGRGFFHTATGPIAYGVALAMTGGVVAALLGAADGISTELLSHGFAGATHFAGVLDNPKFNGVFTATDAGQGALNGVGTVALGLIAVFGVVPVALGYMMEMVFREGAILVLVATIPVTAAGLVAQTTASWFWRSLRWIVAAIVMKPALALVLVVGVSTLANPQGLGGLLAGVGILLMALFCPFALFRLLAFVDPGTGAGAASRAWASSMLGSMGSGGGGQVDTSSGTDSAEASNTARFDQASSGSGGGSGNSGGGPGGAGGGSGGGSGGGWAALGGAIGQATGQIGGAVDGAAAWSGNFANAQMDATGVGDPGGGRMPAGSSGSRSGSSNGSSGGSGSAADDAGGDAAAPAPGEPAPPGGDPGSSGGTGSGGGGHLDPPTPQPPAGHDGGGQHGGGGGKPGGVSAGEVEEAAVVL